MTREDIIRMAREADIIDFRDADDDPHTEQMVEFLERFAALVAAAEREADQRAFWEACRPHGKAGEVIYTTYKHIRTRNNE